MRIGFFVLLGWLLFASVKAEDAEKQVVFYPTYGFSVEENWQIPFRLWISEDLDMARRLSLKLAREIAQKKAGIDELSEAQEALFKARAEDFFRDSESGEIIEIQFEDDPISQSFVLTGDKGENKTDRNGNLEGSLLLSQARAKELLKAQSAKQGWLSFKVVSKGHSGQGKVRLIPPAGLSVISDIDDTIKLTNIPSGSQTVIINTFFKAFQYAEDMQAKYAGYDKATAFHYVSGGPWQLYSPLADYLLAGSVGFPAGSFHMKNVRTNLTESETYQDIGKLLGGGATQVQKIAQISQIIQHFPSRQFVLIGDSGEHDPEVFRQIESLFPEQIKRIYIRDIVDAATTAPKRLAGMEVIAVTVNVD